MVQSHFVAAIGREQTSLPPGTLVIARTLAPRASTLENLKEHRGREPDLAVADANPGRIDGREGLVGSDTLGGQ